MISASRVAARPFVVALSFVALFVLSPRPALAKDMANRLGIGYEDQFSVDMPGIAAKFYPSHDVGVSGVVGIDTQQGASRFGLLGKIHKIIFHEDNLHFYMGAGAGTLSSQSAGTTNSGFVLMAFCGAEFFFAGLENLGFSFETGVGVDSVSNAVRFRTFGDSPLRAGITFYF